jgi:putative glutamine amidotransferase
VGDRVRSAPLIGVSTSEMREAGTSQPTPHGDPGQREMALGMTYMRAIELAGGIPVVLPPLAEAAIDPLLERLSGVCLSGGPDLDPVAYSATRHRQLGPTEPELDRFELSLMRGADRIGLPVLGICRGAQAINVARGGTLRQHLANHRQGLPGSVATHEVALEPGSRLAQIIGEGPISVNSFHHQAVRRLGRGLRGVAHSPDAVVEAIEDPGADFVIGVQWHAETLVERPEQLCLLLEFVAAAVRYGNRVPVQSRSVRAA